MSIEYFVEGDIREHFNGDIKVYTKGNIVYSSQKSVQMSSETGITYGTPDKINENDSPANEIDVVLNLFFDGTQNNKNNTQLGEKSSLSNGDDDSYTNDYSNVAKGYDAVDPNADRQVKVYIEGIGTVDSKRDNLSWAGIIPNNIGSPMGEGDRGIEAKVTRGCIKAAQELFNKFETTEISVLKINVFGFSRGAAAARHFVHICHKPALVMIVDRYNMRVLPPKDYEHPENETKTETSFLLDKHEKDFTDRYGYFGACLLKSGVKVKEIRFNFAGLYDTVASYGLNHRGNWFVKNDSEQLHLDAVKNCRVVVQFATQEEFRENFSLTNVKKSGIRGIDLILPGVHSDIGGGYKNNVRENVLIYKGTKENCEKYKKILIEEGWYKDSKEELEIEERHTRDYSTYKLIGKRVLSNHYSRIPLL
ncbi:MAG: T6SS phospholipase effector Tle1-like catalytic domain-containing protein, partial [Flavobacteriaceae bacterium]